MFIDDVCISSMAVQILDVVGKSNSINDSELESLYCFFNYTN